MIRTQVQPDDFEDLRIAVVMNGGVSLAIWIGGVSLELNRLVHSETGGPGAYGELLDLVRATARVDVIAGTSAGGINGAFLALATAYGQGLDGLGELWAERGGLLDLLRSPTEADPPSLLRGDAYFLPELRAAFERIVPTGRRPKRTDPLDVPISLTMTTSLMNGTTRRFVDDFGTPVVEVEHKGRFVWERGPQHPADPFEDPDLTAKLALASRSTASFPIAFEPSFIPVGTAGPDELHPDMAGIARWPASRFVLDGGVLLNKPMKPALEAIFAQPADRQVRRVLAYVVPDPGDPREPAPDTPADAPTGARVLADTLVRLPRAQSIADELAEVRSRNRHARSQRLVRADLGALLGDRVDDLAADLFDVYRVVRARRAIAHVADVVGPLTAAPATAGGPPAWTMDDFLVGFGADGPRMDRDLPFVPATWDLAAADPWDWGLAPAERVGATVLDVLRRALLATPWQEADLRGRLRGHRSALHGHLDTLRRLRRDDTAFWMDRAADLGQPPKDTSTRAERMRAWVNRSVARWPVAGEHPAVDRDLMVEGVRRTMRRTTYDLADLLVSATADLRAAVAAGRGSPDPMISVEAARLGDLLDGIGLGGRRTARTSERVVRRLLAVDVVGMALTGRPPEFEQEVHLVQVSGDTPNGFDGPSETAEKLAGVQIGHFGAFYKRSWRVSDWIWGRVDGATRLVQIVLGPARLRQLGMSAAEVREELERIALGGPDGERLRERWQREAHLVDGELAFLDDLERPVPPSLPVTAMAVARRIHAEILQTELARLAAAVRYDVRQGGGSGVGVEFAEAYDAATRTGGKLAPDAALALFAGARIATERATAEVGTDLFAKTTSRAAAVGASAADAKRSGLGVARAITRALRGFTLTLYALVYGATVGSRFGAAVVNAALATGGALLAVGVIAEDPPAVVRGIGAVLLLAGLTHAALRARLWCLALALGLPLASVLAVVLARDDGRDLRADLAPILTVAGLVVALMAVGSVRCPDGTPPLTRRRPSWAWFLGGLALTLAAFCWMKQLSQGRILHLEFAFDRESALDELAKWQDLDRGFRYVLVDYAFAAAYWFPFAVAAVAAGRWYRALEARKAERAVASFAWLPLWAAVLDGVENALLLLQVDAVRDGRVPADYLAPLAAVAAGWKFLLLAVTLGYVLGPAFVALRRLLRPSP